MQFNPAVIMKLSPSSLALLVALMGCLAFASAMKPIARGKIVLNTVAGVNGTNPKQKGVFSFAATAKQVTWKLALKRVDSFTGSHIHLNNPPANGPIVGKRKEVGGG